MAHSISAKKRIRQNQKRRIRNRARRSALKTAIRAVTDAASGSDAAATEAKFRKACKLLDREANRGLIHRNAAARKKSRLAARIAALRAKATQ